VSRSRWLGVVAIVLGVAAIAALLIELAGLDAILAAQALARGAFGDGRRIGVTLLRTTPLLLAGLAVAVAFRAGLWNIGAEGQFIIGAVVAGWAATRTAVATSPILILVLGLIAGAVWGGLAGLLRAWRGVPEVISTIMLNFIAIETLSLVVQGPLRESAGRYPQTDPVPIGGRLASFGSVPVGLLVGLATAAALFFLLRSSRLGLELRAAGLGPQAAAAAGIRVRAQTIWVFATSGALAGFAGAVELTGSIHRLYEGYAPGIGFTAIAVALLARLHPLAIVPSALFFGALTAGAESMERTAGVPAVLSAVVQALIMLAGVVVWRRSGGAR